MKVIVYKKEEGKGTVVVQKTRRDELPTVVLHNCTKADMKAVVAKTIELVAAEPVQP